MPINRDAILMETVRTHRHRLLAALLYGEQERRPLATSHVARVVGSLVLAAVGCAGCVAYAVIVGALGAAR